MMSQQEWQHVVAPNGRCYICGEVDPDSAICDSRRRWRESCAAMERRATFKIVEQTEAPRP